MKILGSEVWKAPSEREDSIDVDFGPHRYVLWCWGSICHQVFTFVQIGHTVLSHVRELLQYGTAVPRPKKEKINKMEKRPKKKKTFGCSICCDKFNSMHSLDNHMLDKHAKITRKFSCFICKQRFSSEELLSQHYQRFHRSGVLQNPGQKCPICYAEFSNFTLLNQHVASKHQPSELRKKLLKWKYY